MVKEKLSQIGETVLEKIDGLDVKDKLIEHSFNHSDITRNDFMLKGALASEGYDWWWHSFTGHNKKTGEEKAFFIEFFTINPELGGDEPVFGQMPENKAAGEIKLYKKILKTKDTVDNKKAEWKWELVDDMEAYNIGCEFGEYDK